MLGSGQLCLNPKRVCLEYANFVLFPFSILQMTRRPQRVLHLVLFGSPVFTFWMLSSSVLWVPESFFRLRFAAIFLASAIGEVRQMTLAHILSRILCKQFAFGGTEHIIYHYWEIRCFHIQLIFVPRCPLCHEYLVQCFVSILEVHSISACSAIRLVIVNGTWF